MRITIESYVVLLHRKRCRRATRTPQRGVGRRYLTDEHAFWGKKLKTLKIELDQP